MILPCSFSTVPSGIPQSIQAEPIDSRSLLLAWEPPLAEEQNGVIQEYLINISVSETGDEFQFRSTNTTLIVEDLHAHYTYSFVISAVTIGPGPYSEVYTVQMPEDGRSLIYTYCNPIMFCMHKLANILMCVLTVYYSSHSSS